MPWKAKITKVEANRGNGMVDVTFDVFDGATIITNTISVPPDARRTDVDIQIRAVGRKIRDAETLISALKGDVGAEVDIP
jgi:hypothetical protein